MLHKIFYTGSVVDMKATDCKAGKHTRTRTLPKYSFDINIHNAQSSSPVYNCTSSGDLKNHSWEVGAVRVGVGVVQETVARSWGGQMGRGVSVGRWWWMRMSPCCSKGSWACAEAPSAVVVRHLLPPHPRCQCSPRSEWSCDQTHTLRRMVELQW